MPTETTEMNLEQRENGPDWPPMTYYFEDESEKTRFENAISLIISEVGRPELADRIKTELIPTSSDFSAKSDGAMLVYAEMLEDVVQYYAKDIGKDAKTLLAQSDAQIHYEAKHVSINTLPVVRKKGDGYYSREPLEK